MTTTTTPLPIPQPHHYIRFSISPPPTSSSATTEAASKTGAAIDALQIRHTLQTALAQSFGATLSHIYIDILWVSPSSTECIVRTGGASDAASLMAAVAVANGNGNGNNPRLSALKESPFLPSVSVSVSGENGKKMKIF